VRERERVWRRKDKRCLLQKVTRIRIIIIRFCELKIRSLAII